MIEISQVAAEEIIRIKSTKKQPDSKLKVGIEEGGCSGLIYRLSLDAEALESGDQKKFEFESNGIKVVVNASDYPSLKGIKIDYAEDLMGGGFRFDNPHSQNSCSCGNSFEIKKSD